MSQPEANGGKLISLSFVPEPAPSPSDQVDGIPRLAVITSFPSRQHRESIQGLKTAQFFHLFSPKTLSEKAPALSKLLGDYATALKAVGKPGESPMKTLDRCRKSCDVAGEITEEKHTILAEHAQYLDAARYMNMPPEKGFDTNATDVMIGEIIVTLESILCAKPSDGSKPKVHPQMLKPVELVFELYRQGVVGIYNGPDKIIYIHTLLAGSNGVEVGCISEDQRPVASHNFNGGCRDVGVSSTVTPRANVTSFPAGYTG